MNKTLLGLALGVISLSPLAFASADTIDGFTSSSEICVANISDTSSVSTANSYDNSCAQFIYSDDDNSYYMCASLSPVPYNLINSAYNNGSAVLVSSSNYCISTELFDEDGDISFGDSSNENNYDFTVSGKLYFSKSPITYSSSSDSSDDNSSIIPTIPSSFTSGLTSLLSNFGSTIVNWLPTIILLSLGIYCIFALFRVVRNYARSSFNG